MLSPKLLRILRSKSPFTEDQISQLTENDGWNWVYTNLSPRKQKQSGSEICFTGFGINDKAELSLKAAEAGLHVVGSVTKGLVFLCVGENPGYSKIAKAQDQNVQLLDAPQFLNLIETGELP
ncbi:MAG: hypothetical protein BWK72_04020 [Rhodoferax ferrireducens]|uniref:BRCT domain-containing protein n=1 Tax=Rhodoferax ferrireducens TaxID=192843 RepID=A0A1W9KWY1_9BURK|nr:MAG: hypothetical protein BWK72_04020 [Rhodoferax ferrireducens]